MTRARDAAPEVRVTRAVIGDHGFVLDTIPTLEPREQITIIIEAASAATQWTDLEPDPAIVARLDAVIAEAAVR